MHLAAKYPLLQVKSSMRRLPNIQLTKTVCSVVSDAPSADYAAEPYNDSLLCLVTSGSVVMAPPRAEGSVCHAGDAYVDSNDPPPTRVYFQNTTYIDIAMPRWLLIPFITDTQKAFRQRKLASPSAPVIRLLARYAESLFTEDTVLSPTVARLAADHIRDLIIALLEPGLQPAEAAEKGNGCNARLQAIKCDILANLGRCDLCLDDIAQRHGISAQYIRTLFRSEGTTFTDFVRTERLKRAYRMLTDSRYALKSISTIALECGFDDLSYFNRLFRRRYGMTPTEAKAAMLYGR